MYDDFWLYKVEIKDILPKSLKTTSDIMASNHNIAYTNIRCRTASSEIRERLGKRNKYEVGEILIARKWVNIPRNNINLRCRIVKIEGGKIRLKNMCDDRDAVELSEENIDDIFIYSYCATYHSSQGASVRGNITIHEWQSKYAIREWLWISITKCVDFRNVSFFLNPDFNEEMEVNMHKRYFQSKVKGYKAQNWKKAREVDSEEYVDVKWMMDRMNSNCQRYNKKFNFTIKNGSLCSDFTT